MNDDERRKRAQFEAELMEEHFIGIQRPFKGPTTIDDNLFWQTQAYNDEDLLELDRAVDEAMAEEAAKKAKEAG